MDPDKKYFGRWWVWILTLMVLTAAVFGGLRIVGVFGERIIFKESFQYKEARSSEIATYSAQLAEIDRKLSSSDIDATTRTNLESQAAAIRILLSVARSK